MIVHKIKVPVIHLFARPLLNTSAAKAARARKRRPGRELQGCATSAGHRRSGSRRLAMVSLWCQLLCSRPVVKFPRGLGVLFGPQVCPNRVFAGRRRRFLEGRRNLRLTAAAASKQLKRADKLFDSDAIYLRATESRSRAPAGRPSRAKVAFNSGALFIAAECVACRPAGRPRMRWQRNRGRRRRARQISICPAACRPHLLQQPCVIALTRDHTRPSFPSSLIAPAATRAGGQSDKWAGHQAERGGGRARIQAQARWLGAPRGAI